MMAWRRLFIRKDRNIKKHKQIRTLNRVNAGVIIERDFTEFSCVFVPFEMLSMWNVRSNVCQNEMAKLRWTGMNFVI